MSSLSSINQVAPTPLIAGDVTPQAIKPEPVRALPRLSAFTPLMKERTGFRENPLARRIQVITKTLQGEREQTRADCLLEDHLGLEKPAAGAAKPAARATPDQMLEEAIANRSLEGCLTALQHGARLKLLNVEAKTTILHLIAYEGSVSDLERIEGLELPLDAQDVDGSTAVHYAAVLGKTDLCAKLVELGANPNMLNLNQHSPFVLAIKNRQFETARWLQLNTSVDYSQVSLSKNTPFHYLSSQQVPIDLLHSALASSTEKINERNHFGNTPLMNAVIEGNYKRTAMLIKAGAEVNICYDRINTLEILALKGGHYKVAELIRKLSSPEQNILTREIIHTKLLFARLGMRASSKLSHGETVQLEVIHSHFSSNAIASSIAAFFATETALATNTASLNLITRAFHRVTQNTHSSAEEIKERLDRGEMVILATRTEKHLVPCLLYGDYIIIANSGYGCKVHPISKSKKAVQPFHVCRGEITLEKIQELQTAFDGLESEESLSERKRLLTTGSKRSKFEKVRCLEQRTGNCSFEGLAHLVLPAIFFARKLDRSKPKSITKIENALHVYHRWLRHDRERAGLDYLLGCPAPNYSLYHSTTMHKISMPTPREKIWLEK